jgi:hypothetical protein
MWFPENFPLNQSIEHLMFRRMLIVWRNLWASQPRQICDLARPAKQLLASWEVVCQAASNLSKKKVFPRSFHLRFQELLRLWVSDSIRPYDFHALEHNGKNVWVFWKILVVFLEIPWLNPTKIVGMFFLHPLRKPWNNPNVGDVSAVFFWNPLNNMYHILNPKMAKKSYIIWRCISTYSHKISSNYEFL